MVMLLVLARRTAGKSRKHHYSTEVLEVVRPPVVRDGLASAPQLPAHDHWDAERDRDGKEDASEGKDTT